MLVFRELTINFDPTRGRTQRESATAVFSGTVRTAQAVLKGFNIKYSDGDHHILAQEIDLDSTIVVTNGVARSVNVFADFLLRDSSGNIDDRFEGWVQCVVIADVV